MSKCKPLPSKPDSDPKPFTKGGSSNSVCPECTITSKTWNKSPLNRARTRIGVAEEVILTVNPGPATWKISSGGGYLDPEGGSHTEITYIAGDTAEKVTITATVKVCPNPCEITFDVVEPSCWKMERKPGTKVAHEKKGMPHCAWQGITWIQPTDVNFNGIEVREKDSKCKAEGCYKSADGTWHGKYEKRDKNGDKDENGVRASPWLQIGNHDPKKGSYVTEHDTVDSGEPDYYSEKPPFTKGKVLYSITMQWRVGYDEPVKDFPVTDQVHEIFDDGKCVSTKGGNTESTMYDDDQSNYQN